MNVFSKFNSDKRLCLIICMYFFWLSISNLLVLVNIFTTDGILNNVYKAIFAIIIISVIPTIYSKKNIYVFWICIIVSVFFGVNFLYIGYIENYHIEILLKYLTYSLPFMLIAMTIDCYDRLLRWMTITSHIIGSIVCLMVVLFFYGKITFYIGTGFFEKYSMSLGYSLLFPMILLIYDFYKSKKIILRITIIFFLLSIFFLLISFASRGVLLAPILLIIHICLYVVICRKKFLLLLFIFTLTGVMSIYLEELLIYFSYFLEDYDINSRNFDLLVKYILYNDIHTSGRDVLYKVLLDEFLNEPFSVRGINAEYSLIGGYAHNIFVELFYQYGIFIGGIFILIISYGIIYTIRFSLSGGINDVMMLFMYASLPQLLVSSSLWQSLYFWGWLILCYKKYKLMRRF